MQNKYVLLLYPPYEPRGYLEIYPSLPVLAGALSGAGYPSKQIDLNNAFLYWYLKSRHYMQKINCARKIESALEKKKSLDRSEYSKYQLIKKILLLDELLQRNKWHKVNDIAYSIFHFTIGRDLHFYDKGGRVLPRNNSLKIVSEFYKSHFSIHRLAEPLFIGISAPMPRNVAPAVLLARHLRKILRKGVKIILGGSAITLVDDYSKMKILSASSADGAVVGEGEESVIQIADQLSRGNWHEHDIPNFIYAKNCTLIKSAEHPIKTLDEYPAPVYDKSEIKKWKPFSVSVVLGRKCYWGRCAFCNFQSLYKRHQRKTSERLVSDIRRVLKQYNIPYFHFVCDTLEPCHVKEISRLLLTKRIRIKWNCFLRADTSYTDADFRLMKRAGCNHVAVGLEALDDKILKKINKGYSRKEAEVFLKGLFSSGISARVDMIIDLPGTSFDSAKKQFTLLKNMLVKAREKCDADYRAAVYHLEILGRSPLASRPERYGISIVKTAHKHFLYQLCGLPFRDPTGMNAAQKLRIEKYYERLNMCLKGNSCESAISKKRPQKIMYNRRNIAIRNFVFDSVVTNEKKIFRRIEPVGIAYNYARDQYTLGHNLKLVATLSKQPQNIGRLESSIGRKLVKDLLKNGVLVTSEKR